MANSRPSKQVKIDYLEHYKCYEEAVRQLIDISLTMDFTSFLNTTMRICFSANICQLFSDLKLNMLMLHKRKELVFVVLTCH